MLKNLLLVLLLLVLLITSYTSIPPSSFNKNNVGSMENEILVAEGKNSNNIIFKKVFYDSLELNIFAEIGNVDPFYVPLKIRSENNKNELSTYIKYKDRDFINILSNGDILINGKYLVNSSNSFHELFKDKYIFDFAVNKKLDLMALLCNDNGISLFLYDFTVNKLKKF